jgi:hypothetical protein
MMKLSLEQIKMRNKAIEKSKENPEQLAENIKKHEEQKQGKTVIEDEFEITTFN